MNLSAPWYIYYQKLLQLFGDDPEIDMLIKDENNFIIYVENVEKANALSKLLPPTKTFGNVEVNITIVPANKDEQDILDVFEDAFKDNPNFVKTESFLTPRGDSIKAVVMAKKVAQYYSDDIKKPSGYTSALFEDIARDVFDDKKDVLFWTNVEVNKED